MRIGLLIAAIVFMHSNQSEAADRTSPGPQPAFMPELANYREYLQGLGVTIDAAGLRRHLENDSKPVTEAYRARFRELVSQLGDDDFNTRELASQRLGAIAADLLWEMREPSVRGNGFYATTF